MFHTFFKYSLPDSFFEFDISISLKSELQRDQKNMIGYHLILLFIPHQNLSKEKLV